MPDIENTPRIERIYAAMWRPRLWLGCDIVPLLLTFGGGAMLCVVAFAYSDFKIVGIAAVFVIAVMYALRRAAEYDPDFFSVMWRFRKYDRVFSAVASVNSPLPNPRRHQR